MHCRPPPPKQHRAPIRHLNPFCLQHSTVSHTRPHTPSPPAVRRSFGPSEESSTRSYPWQTSSVWVLGSLFSYVTKGRGGSLWPPSWVSFLPSEGLDEVFVRTKSLHEVFVEAGTAGRIVRPPPRPGVCTGTPPCHPPEFRYHETLGLRTEAVIKGSSSLCVVHYCIITT